MATTTPNFGWSVPTSSDLVKNGATAIETLGDAIDASLVDLKGGTTGQVLSKASNTDMDFVWAADAGGFTYTAWTPTFSGTTVGNGTLTARYAQSGKMVHAYLKLVLGSTSSVSGNTTITLPVTAASSSGGIRGTGAILDSGVRWYTAAIDLNATTSATLVAVGANLTNAFEDYFSSTVPMTWTTGDTMAFSFIYEAA
jgi:hypothetical protein